MGWVGRVAMVSTTLIVGCASIAGISDDPGASEDDTRGANLGSSGTSGTNGVTGPPSGGGGTDAGVSSAPRDASPDDGATAADAAPPACTKKANGIACVSKVECCAGGCNELKLCGACKSQFDGCDPGDEAPCCAGLFCSTVAVVPTCQTCVPAGVAPRAQFIGGGEKSCCSKKSNAGLCT